MLIDVAGRFPSYGYRKIAEQLKREGSQISYNLVRVLMREMGLGQKVKKKKCFTTNSKHDYPRYPNLVQGLQVQRIDQIWASDISFIKLGKDFIYLAVVVDIFTRSIRGWDLSRNIDHHLSLTALRKGLDKGTPEIHHSDQGVQYAAEGYIDLLKSYGIKISMAEVGQAWQNGYCERLIRTIKDDEVYLTEYQSFQEAYKSIGYFIEEIYPKQRIHESLGYLTPDEFEDKHKKEKCFPSFKYK